MFFLIISINNNNIAYNSIMITIIAWFNLDFEIRIFRLQYTRSCSRPCPLVDRYLSHPKSCLLAAILFKILCTMRVKRFAPIRHVPILIHDVVPVAGSVRLANTAKVDIGVAIWIFRDPYVVSVLKWNSSLFSDRLFVFTPFSVCRLQFIEPILECLGTSIKLSLCLLKSSLRTFMLCFSG